MRNGVCAFGIFLALVLAGPAPAQPELLEAYAASPTMWNAELSQEGRWVATGCGQRGVRSVCIYDLEGEARPRLFPSPENGRITSFHWANDRHLIIYLTFTWQRGASDAHPIYRIDRAIAVNAETGNEAFLLNDEDRVDSLTNVVSLDLSDPGSVIMRLALERPVSQTAASGNPLITNDLYRVDLETGDATRIERSRDGHVRSPLLGPNGELVAEMASDVNLNIYAVHNAAGEEVFRQAGGGRPPSLLAALDGGAAVALYLREGESVGLHRLDLASGEVVSMPHPTNNLREVSPVIDQWSRNFVGFSFYRSGIPAWDFVDPELLELNDELQDVLQGALGDVAVRLISWDRRRNKFVVEVRAAATPTQYFLFERDSNALSPLGSEADGLNGQPMANVEAFSYAASDGLEIPSYLVTPPGMSAQDGPFPLIVMPHGGPYGRDDAGYDWWAQYYASQGYAVLKANFRGSSGYGIGYREAGYGEFGGLMIQDLLDGVDYLIAEGIARPDGYCAAGGSYGGYASLMLGLVDRERVRCMISIAPVTDPTEMVHTMFRNGDISAMRYWQYYLQRRASDDPAAVAISPYRRHAEFDAPILLLHGVHDTNVRIIQSRQLERAMRRNRLLNYIELAEEDHYFTRTDSRERLLRESTALLAEHLPVQ